MYSQAWARARARLQQDSANTTRLCTRATAEQYVEESDNAGRKYVQGSGQRAGAVFGATVLHQELGQRAGVLDVRRTVAASSPHVLQTRPALVVHRFGVGFVLRKIENKTKNYKKNVHDNTRTAHSTHP